MNTDFNNIKQFILKWEGKYSTQDGMPTMKGVTLETFKKAYGDDMSENELKNITDEQWDNIFKTYYWDPLRADEITSSAITAALVDWYWNSGTIAIKDTQRLVNTTADGIVGNDTISKINDEDEHNLFFRIINQRKWRLIRLKSWIKFKKGWMNRLINLQETFLK